MQDAIARVLRMAGIGMRGRRIIHASSWSLIAKACAAAHLFLSVPFALRALGSEQFGAWATLVAFVVFAGFLDFGIGNGAMNLVAEAHGRKDDAQAAAILRAARAVLVRIAFALLLPIVLLGVFVPWHDLLGLPGALSGQSRMAAMVVLATILVSIPLNLANRAQLGLGRGERTFRWQAIGQLAALATVVLVSFQDASLAALTAASVVPPVLGSLANALHLNRDPLWNARSLDQGQLEGTSRAIRTEGLAFFGLQLAAALAFTADLPLISALSGPHDAATYAIVQRLFSAIPLCLSLVWAPLWPIYRQALAAGDHQWVSRTFRRSMGAAVLFATASALVIALGSDVLLTSWVRTPLAVPTLLVAGFATWCVVEAAGTAMATLLNAASVLRYQLVTSAIFALTCLAGKAWVITLGHVELLPWVTTGTYLASNVLPLLWLRARIVAGVFASRGDVMAGERPAPSRCPQDSGPSP